MFDILMYLFESYILGQINLKVTPNHLTDKLRQAGFQRDDIAQAFQWIENLAEPIEVKSTIAENAIHSNGMRIYSPQESTRLSRECRGFITMLEQSGVLTADTRERIIERALALDIDYLEITEIKLIVLMVLGAHSDDEKKVDLLQELLLSEKCYETLH